jgi:hypothetical protein
MIKAIGKVALFMMIGRSSSWQIFLVGYEWQYDATYIATTTREIRIFYLRYSEF